MAVDEWNKNRMIFKEIPVVVMQFALYIKSNYMKEIILETQANYSPESKIKCPHFEFHIKCQYEDNNIGNDIETIKKCSSIIRREYQSPRPIIKSK